VHPIRLGTCGWSYDDWRGKFYSEGLKPAEYLPFYAERYPVVEVDSTFYRTPSLSMVRGWDEKTPEGFGFSLKVPQIITHEKVLADCQEELDGFVAAARLLGPKLLACVLQFGYFNKSKFASLKAFLERLDPFLAGWPSDVPVAVEIRNKNWLAESFLACLRRHRAAWVLPDQAWMPSPRSLVEKFDAATGPFAYVRLLGDRVEVDKRTETLDHVVIDRGDQIRDDAQAIRLLSQRVPVLVFVNNHYAGYAPQTLEELQVSLAEP
jgi:uncharacterized protein YecE (DUF72 family)